MKFLTRKFGPLPVWGYAAVAVSGFVFLRWRASKQSSLSGTTVAQQVPGDALPPYGGQLSPEWGPGYPGQFALSPATVPTSAAAVTNAQAGPYAINPLAPKPPKLPGGVQFAPGGMTSA